MLSEAMTALAAAGGTALVQAAGTDAWTEFRQQVARWFGRGNPQRENAAVGRLDQTAVLLETAGPTEVERVRLGQVAAWQARIEDLLESLDGTEQGQAAEELRALLAQHASQGAGSAGQGGLAVGGDYGSVAAGVVHGNVSLGRPADGHTSPGPENDPDDDWPRES
ncbi:hypothetical protein [Streptomyces sp. NBC_00271]|uniref:hypothetical protein n=1 Tax=Streptomyces sp. NBC_00271 TaxID=2975697 RepID=UPI002E2E6FBF|nr:hypothetical protein [Streptomyces sp. NBC_00271]